MPLVSVIVRTKDRPAFLREALESLATQTHQPLQVIVVNDGGVDVTSVIEEFSDRFDKLDYLVHENPRGRSAAANTGLSAVEGEFFAFLDDDDLLLPDHFETLLTEVGPDIVPYSRVRYEIYDSQKRLLKTFSPWEGDFDRRLLILGNFIPFHSLLFPKVVKEEIGLLDEEFDLFEDWDYLLRVSKVFSLRAVDRVTAIYRFFEGGIARSFHGSQQEKEVFFKILKKHSDLFSPEAFYFAYLRRAALRYEISILQEELLKREKEIFLLREQSRTFQKEIQKIQAELEKTRQRLEEAIREQEKIRQEKEEVARTLRLMEETLGWQLLLRLRRLLERTAPRGSRREKALSLSKFLLRGLLVPEHRTLLKEETKKFFRYVRSFGLRAALARAVSKLDAPPALPGGEKVLRGGVLEAILSRKSPPLPSLEDPVTVVIPVYNAFEKLQKCLASVLAHTDLSRVHLLVIDDASTDQRLKPYLQALAEEHGFELRFHAENRGFVATVNEAIVSRKGHLVVLNSDTEVPPLWLERLLAPILVAPEKVASTTPFSNRATICSFPEFCKDNDLPPGYDVEELDALFRLLWGKVEPIEIPTGVGFCMAFSDLALKRVGKFDEKTFGRGYGEENDWCLRAAKQGLKNLLVPWLFVAHHHGASFGPEKERLAEEGVRRVERKHPGYLRQIHAFIARDPAREIRETVNLLVKYRKAPSPRLMAFSHGLGGGSEFFLNDIKKLLHEDAFTCLFFKGKNFLLSCRDLSFGLGGRPEFIKKLTELLQPDLLFVNHLAGAEPFEEILQTLEEASLPRLYFLHDYLPLCPSYSLIDERGRFCGLPKDGKRCVRCLRGDFATRGMVAGVPRVSDLNAWRASWRKFFRKTTVIAPSRAAAELFLRVYPETEVEVIPHHVEPLTGYFPPPRETTKPLRVAFFGGLNLYKGAEVLYRLAERIRRENLPLQLVLFGYTYRETRREGPPLTITGPYRREELAELCRRYRPEVACIPSIWPETFSYTLSEAWSLGLPTLVFDLGAQAERVRESGAGLVLPYADEEALLSALLDLVQNPELLSRLQERARRWRGIDREEWAVKWRQRLKRTPL